MLPTSVPFGDDIGLTAGVVRRECKHFGQFLSLVVSVFLGRLLVPSGLYQANTLAKSDESDFVFGS
jgi:hypothetical protein